MGKAANLDFLEAAQSPRLCSPHSAPRESETPICLLGFQHRARQVIRRERLGRGGGGLHRREESRGRKKETLSQRQLNRDTRRGETETNQRKKEIKETERDRETERDKARREGERQTD